LKAAGISCRFLLIIDREISKYYYDYRLNQLENIAKKREFALIYGKNGGINNG
jgi:hypothetical protein